MMQRRKRRHGGRGVPTGQPGEKTPKGRKALGVVPAWKGSHGLTEKGGKELRALTWER